MQKALKLLAAKDLLKEGTEDINASAVVYKRHYREEEDVKREHEVSFAGTKEVVPILTLAIEKGNLDAVALLLDAGIDIATQLKRSYRMISISLEKQQLYKLGRDYKQAVKAVKKPDPKKISKSISPPWVPGENTWEPEGTVTSRNPFEQAFNDQNFDLFAIFCQSEQIKNMAGRLELSSDRIPWPKKDGLWPQSFGSLRSLTQLCIHCPRSTGPVPGVIFKLTALTHLELSGCGYTFLSDEIAELVNLQELDVSHTKLTKLPVSKMARMRQLTAVNCAGVKLASPPPEIAKQGPTAVARYILDLDAGTVENTDVLLMLIGDGEAGKTSTLQSLRNTDTNSAEAIGVDDRTIGIDISEFKPFRELPLRFFAWDFGGQAVYAIMQQLFMTRRALYPLLWRVRESLDLSKLNPLLKCDVCRKPLLRPTNATAPPAETKSHTKADSKGERRGTKKGSKIEKAVEPVQRQQAVYRVKGQGLCHAGCISYETLISAWTEHLQFRVPGVTVVLVATHIDCASPEQVDEQCAAVAEVAQRIVSRQRALHTDIPPLRIHNNGQSLRVSNLTGEGVSELREQLRLAAERLDFYGEVMPSSYVQLRKKLREMQARDTEHWRTWITWDDYREVAFKCGIVDADAVKVATRFFHETGELRYFGDSFVTNMSASRMQMRSEGLLNTTVFPNPFWVVDVLRHLIRHDHSEVRAVIAADPKLSKKQIKALDRRVCRLVTNGALHKSLLPYIWQGIAGKFKDASANEDEFHRLIALLQAFDILMVKPHDNSGCDWIVPSLSAGKTARTIDASAFEEDDKMPFVCRMVYDALPPFFDMIFVAHVMNAGSAQSVEFIRGGASFRKFGDRAMVFAGLGKVRDPRQVFRQDQLDENYMHDMLREDQSHVVVTASSRRFLNQLLKDVGRLEEFFPGLQRLGAFFPCYTCRKLRQDRMSRTIAASAKEGQALSPEELGKQQLQLAEENDLKQRKCLAEVAGAKLSTCNEYFDKHKDVLSEAFYTVEPQLQSLVVLGRWFSRGGSMKMSYNSLRKKGCGRYYEEVSLDAGLVCIL
jgi:GTPase SAR1 family protein